MKKRNVTDNSMYSGTPCDKCEGPTLLLGMGSIWCPAEDPHPGGHFVSRVAFERTPAKQRAFEASHPTTPRRGAMTAPMRAEVIRERQSDREAKRLLRDEFGGGMDDFVRSDER